MTKRKRTDTTTPELPLPLPSPATPPLAEQGGGIDGDKGKTRDLSDARKKNQQRRGNKAGAGGSPVS
jgi:hypothetical protein